MSVALACKCAAYGKLVVGVRLKQELGDEFGGDFDEFDEFGGRFSCLREREVCLMSLGVLLMSLGVRLKQELGDEFGGGFDEFDEFGGAFVVRLLIFFLGGV